jgi:methionine sulfoxide reductase heme-binding subunit
MTKSDSGLSGVRLFLLLAGGVLAMVLLMVAADSGGTDGLRLAIRATARTSLALFLIAFCASALVKYRPTDFAKWILQNRRWFGLGFAFSHFVHAGLLIALINADSALFWTLTNMRSVVTGSIAYIFIALLAATSLDGAVKALGARRWQLLHRTGIWVIWVSFVFTNGKRIPVSLWYSIPVALLFAALAFRLFAGRASTRANR